MHRPLSFLIAAFASVLLPRAALANPKPLPFSYMVPTLGEGEVEIEQLADLTPVKAVSPLTGGGQYYLATQFQTEFEYGITDRLELGLYVSLAPQPGGLTQTAVLTEANGVKQRLRYRFTDAGRWPIDVGLYAEVVENEREIELEGKVLLQRRFGKLAAVANLWGEREYEYTREQSWVLNPTAGLTYQVTPVFQPGVEGWMRVELPDASVHPRPFELGPHVFVGPTALLSFGKLWWSTGVYLRADDLGRSPQPGDNYGSVWARTIVGIGL